MSERLRSTTKNSNTKNSNRKLAKEQPQKPNVGTAPDLIKKNPIESVITTLPIIMLLGGLAFYYLNERRQVGGEILPDQIELIVGEFSGISQQSDKPEAQRILWIQTPTRLRGGRVNYQQAQQLAALTDGDSLTVWAAPKVQGSKTLWVVRASTNGKPLIGGVTNLPAGTTTIDNQ